MYSIWLVLNVVFSDEPTSLAEHGRTDITMNYVIVYSIICMYNILPYTD